MYWFGIRSINCLQLGHGDFKLLWYKAPLISLPIPKLRRLFFKNPISFNTPPQSVNLRSKATIINFTLFRTCFIKSSKHRKLLN